MGEKKLTEKQILDFTEYLREEEKSALTIEKYVRDVKTFYSFLKGREIAKEVVMDYREHLVETGYAPGSINSMLSSLNSLFRFLGWEECRVRNIRVQRRAYCPEDKELTKKEYIKLVKAAGQDLRLRLILQTICSTGIRVSELSYFTVEAVKSEEISVACKNKVRTIIIPRSLKKLLLEYAGKNGIRDGVIFRTRSGKALNRSNIWACMKRLCKKAGVMAAKVFPHNLRKLFARTFHQAEHDIAGLADVLGHSNINTTRLYIMTTGAEHRQKIERLNLII